MSVFLVYELISRNFDVSRVCKKWYFTIDCLMSFDCLVVYEEFLPINQTFFQSNEELSQHDAVCIHLGAFSDQSEYKKRVYRKFRRICFFDHFRTFKRTYKFYNVIKKGRQAFL